LRLKIARPAWPETTVLLLATANFAHLWWTAHQTPHGGWVTPWYWVFGWANEPFRILIAACLLALAHPAFRLAAVVLAAQPLLFVVYGCLDANHVRFCFHRERVGEYLLLVQGGLAAVIAYAGVAHLLQRRRSLRIVLMSILIVAALGWLASTAATRQCEEVVAGWLAREAPIGRPFYVISSPQGWSVSTDVFRRVGARFVSADSPTDARRAAAGEAGVSSATHPAPFIVRVNFYYRTRPDERATSGQFLFFASAGFVVRLKSVEAWLPVLDDWVNKVTGFPWLTLAVR
jgi:hypothetical protein